jgi:glycosyltransferase involved in cell wall biosynthesis
MKLVQLTPGAGGMFCGNCLRDNALVTELGKLGHDVLMLPLYLPLTLDEVDQSSAAPLFFGGVNVYLEQNLPWFSRAPKWLHRVTGSKWLHGMIGGLAGRTQAKDLGELTLSMLKGADGRQRRELEELVGWLEQPAQRPEVICLSNALLLGMAPTLRDKLGSPIVCSLQGEDWFLDSLPKEWSQRCWEMLAQQSRAVDKFLAPSRYYGDLLIERANLPADKVEVVHNGIQLNGFGPPPRTTQAMHHPPVLGYFARMSPEKGLDLLVDAYIELKRGPAKNLRLMIGGSSGPADADFVEQQKKKLTAAGMMGDVRFVPNATREQKIAFLQEVTVFSVPARYGEGFGLYLLEAWACEVPVVQPRCGAFPELLSLTGGGVLTELNPSDIARGIAEVLDNPARGAEMGKRAATVVKEQFSARAMAQRTEAVVSTLLHKSTSYGLRV